jgi:hypothetical protein
MYIKPKGIGGGTRTMTPAYRPVNISVVDCPLAHRDRTNCRLTPSLRLDRRALPVGLAIYSIPIHRSSLPTSRICGHSGTLYRASSTPPSKPPMAHNLRLEFRFCPSIHQSRATHFQWISVCSCPRKPLPSGCVRYSSVTSRATSRSSIGLCLLRKSLIVHGRGPCGRKIVPS